MKRKLSATRSVQHVVLLAIFLSAHTLLPIAAHADAVDEYWEYLSVHLCTTALPEDCLEQTSYTATRSDGTRVVVDDVYKYVKADVPESDAPVHPHFLLTYMRKLREAYRADISFESDLYNQIDYLLQFAETRNGALVWENRYGYAQGMEQLEYAAFLMSAAEVFGDQGNWRSARGISLRALELTQALENVVGVQSGGVRSATFDCGAITARKRPCYWFHSRGLSVDAVGERTVLNQHLHVVRDILQTYQTLDKARAHVHPAIDVDAEIARLQSHAIAGLYQLAFSAGNTVEQPNRPPNIRQFMEFHENATTSQGNPIDFYWSFYEFDMANQVGKQIAKRNTCHYHTHVLSVLWNTRLLLEENSDFFYQFDDSWRLNEAISALFATADRNDDTGAIYQFALSENSSAIKVRRYGCPCDPWESKSGSSGCTDPDADLQAGYHALYW